MLSSAPRNQRSFSGNQKVIPIIDLKGSISTSPGGLSYDNMAQIIETAFNTPNAVAVALDINSPGGSPAQSELIANLIRRKADETGLKVYAFTQDVAASGGYWLACAADEIYAAKTSVVGSIGVVSSSPDYSEWGKKNGIGERTHTAGKSKRGAGPFDKESQADIDRIEQSLSELHEIFKDWVLERRSHKLDPSLNLDEDVFDGSVWHAKEAVRIGVIDGIGELVPFLQAKFGKDVQFGRVVRQAIPMPGGMPFQGGRGNGSGNPAPFPSGPDLDDGFSAVFNASAAEQTFVTRIVPYVVNGLRDMDKREDLKVSSLPKPPVYEAA